MSYHEPSLIEGSMTWWTTSLHLLSLALFPAMLIFNPVQCTMSSIHYNIFVRYVSKYISHVCTVDTALHAYQLYVTYFLAFCVNWLAQVNMENGCKAVVCTCRCCESSTVSDACWDWRLQRRWRRPSASHVISVSLTPRLQSAEHQYRATWSWVFPVTGTVSRFGLCVII